LRKEKLNFLLRRPKAKRKGKITKRNRSKTKAKRIE
jgi:hypothetical protein